MNTLQSIFRFLANNPQFIIVLIIVGAPILKVIFKSLEEQKQKRTQLTARRRMEDEMLRTGRAPQPMAGARVEADVSARERLEELAARRRAMIEQGATQPQAQTRPPASIPGQMTQVRLPGGIIIEVPAELVPPEGLPGQGRPAPQPQPARPPQPARAQGPRPQQRSAPQRSQAPQPQRAQAQPLARPTQRTGQRSARGPTSPPSQPLATRRPRKPGEQPEELTRATAIQSIEPEASLGYDPTQRTSAARVSLPGMPGTRDEWRRAILLREILGTPVGMRRT